MEQFKIIDKQDKILAFGCILESKNVILEWTSSIKNFSLYDNVEQVKEFVCNDQKDAKFVSLKKTSKEKLSEYFLQRNEDFSGVSGTGVVAKGVILPSGKCVHEWSNSYVQSLNMYPNIKAVEHIHGHEGRTIVKFVE
ncbi:gp248 [Bacillus phage G]|uniref:Gp248 n=1 Tax=Bacillus phage G TaxID=2884420 RepID=G3M9Y9_9CAUD|nr:gp248 [Bacillus phage G]AEO93507.1 gp248 [Bacillus phage G]